MEKYCERTFEAGSLTKEQFIEFLAADIMGAKAEYDVIDKINVRKEWKKAIKCTEQRLTDYYSKRYKRKSTIDRYVNAEIQDWTEKNRWRYTSKGLRSVKWSIEPWNNGGCYYIHIDKNMKEYIGTMYDRSIDNKYFKACTGWSIVIDGWEEYVRLTLSDELQAEWKEDERKLGEAISRFYANTNYWGD